MIPDQYQNFEQIVSIACVNFNTVWGDKQANLKKIKSFVVQAAEQGNNIVAIPELALTGYECDEPGKSCMHEVNAETIPGPSTEEVAAVAKKYDIYVVFGMPERDQNDSKIRYISAAVIGPDGLIGAYRKLHLMSPPLTEKQCFKRGNSLPIFQTRYGPIGVQTCYDFWTFPEITRMLTLKGARIVINSAASPAGPGKPLFIAQQTGARAVENIIYTASANLTGKDRTKFFYGHSTIAGRGSQIAQFYAKGGEEEGLVSATLNFHLLHKLRQTNPIHENFRYDIVVKELKDIYQF
ncbi:MAG: carbon-nitrogen hydrolase family protein [bacterium]